MLTKWEAQIYWCVEDQHPPGMEPGGFRKKLITACLQADDENFAKLELVFPEMCAAIIAWRHGSLRERAKLLGGRP